MKIKADDPLFHRYNVCIIDWCFLYHKNGNRYRSSPFAFVEIMFYRFIEFMVSLSGVTFPLVALDKIGL